MLRSRPIAALAALVALAVAPPALAGDLEVGTDAPGFTLTDQAGNPHALADLEGKIVVLEWTNPQCPFVMNHYKHDTMTDLAAWCAEKDVVWMAVDSSHFVTPESASAWAKKEEIAYPILLDADGTVGRAYGAKTTPHMFVIGKDGTVLYNGAIDDNPKPTGVGETNYVKDAVEAALAGEAVETAHTKPYGCSVKYGAEGKGKAAS
jgi:peroxiredoxin